VPLEHKTLRREVELRVDADQEVLGDQAPFLLVDFEEEAAGFAAKDRSDPMAQPVSEVPVLL
jgi:hypothetical protein